MYLSSPPMFVCSEYVMEESWIPWVPMSTLRWKLMKAVVKKKKKAIKNEFPIPKYPLISCAAHGNTPHVHLVFLRPESIMCPVFLIKKNYHKAYDWLCHDIIHYIPIKFLKKIIYIYTWDKIETIQILFFYFLTY